MVIYDHQAIYDPVCSGFSRDTVQTTLVYIIMNTRRYSAARVGSRPWHEDCFIRITGRHLQRVVVYEGQPKYYAEGTYIPLWVRSLYLNCSK